MERKPSGVIVIGGGAAGMMAALFAAQSGATVTLLEKNEKLGKKIYITGKGRGNLTNTAEGEQFLQHVYRNPRFLYASLSHLDNTATIDLFRDWGCPVKIERGGRAFPVSDHASDITAALTRQLNKASVAIQLNTKVRELLLDDAGCCTGVALEDGRKLHAGAVIICTGGLSYPSTGSTGDGYAFAEQAGHSIKRTLPALVPIDTVEKWPGKLSGLSLKNVRLEAFDRARKKILYSDTGEMLLTHFGLSGPLVLSMSSILPEEIEGLPLEIDLKPALDDKTLDQRLLRDIADGPNKRMAAIMDGLVPHRLGQELLDLADVSEALPANALRVDDRRRILHILKHVPLTIQRRRDYTEAIVTRGGVDTREVAPSTLASKKVQGLYFAGEVLDLDASTGGFNLQIAFSTGALAGACAAEHVLRL